jgi:VWFA-related protein
MFISAVFAQTTFRVPVRLVSAPTLVFTPQGQLVPDLKPADFRLYDNGALQTISLERSLAPISFVVAVQVSLDVRAYLPFISRVGSVIEALVVGATGESALVTYGSEVKLVKPFGGGDIQECLRSISPAGLRARSIDAGLAAIRLLKQRPPRRTRVLLFIGQPIDDGSESTLASLREEAEKENVTIFGLALPEIGKSFASDTFTLAGPSSRMERGGYSAGVDLAKLIAVLNRTADAAAGSDPFTALSAATAGGMFRFRKQYELEGALAAAGLQLHSTYLLTYYPTRTTPGRHTIQIEVDREGARVRARPGYFVE